ncbi:MAG: 2-phospho-L-lactate transferase [Acidimicrobiia bacterium]|nr:MAG: 2-phospho-L-lactate transferase [Acidimicrobiia bacterium]
MNDAIQEKKSRYSNHPRVVVLGGGVGGARAARALASVLPAADLTIVGNVGDDEVRYGVHISADLDTITYTLAGIEGPHGWGVAGDTFAAMDQMAALGEDTTFRLGDRDLANCLMRTVRLADGEALSAVIAQTATALGVDLDVLPATDDPLRTEVLTATGERLAFQEYFVIRAQRDEVAGLSFAGGSQARPAPGVVEAITDADVVLIAPSNPPLSIWPILAVDDISGAVGRHDRVVAISPLFGGVPLKGPADRVLASLGLPPGNEGVAAAYDGLLSDLVVDDGDAAEIPQLTRPDLAVHALDTRIDERDAGKRFATDLLETLGW